MRSAEKVKGDDKELEPQEGVKTTWGDILQSWELEAKRKINPKIRTDFKAEDFLGADEAEISPLSGDIDEPPVASTSQGKCGFVSGVLIWCFSSSSVHHQWRQA